MFSKSRIYSIFFRVNLTQILNFNMSKEQILLYVYNFISINKHLTIITKKKGTIERQIDNTL